MRRPVLCTFLFLGLAAMLAVATASLAAGTIPAFLYMPPGGAKGTPIPFVVNYRGGPEGQERVDRGYRHPRLFGACVDDVGTVNMQGFLEETIRR